MDNNMQISVSSYAFLLWAALLLLLPLQWVMAILFATFFHEFCHTAAILFCGGRVTKIAIGGRGVTMETDGICGFRETICALAGPLGSFLLMLLCRRFPRVAVSGAIQGIYNLLPLFPLDGGRAIRSILFSVLPPPKAKRLFQISQVCVVVLLCIGSCILLFRIGLLIIPIVFLLFRRKWNENSLAKLSF